MSQVLERSFELLHQKAHAAGMAAAQGAKVAPMIVQQRRDPLAVMALTIEGRPENLADSREVVKQWFEPEGVCGFAWVHMKGTLPFAKWAKKANLGHAAYRGGYDIWVREFGQSMQRKEAYARAYAGVLKENGVEAYADSRMD